MPYYTQQFPVNELGEIVTTAGVGSTTVSGSLPVDYIPTDVAGRMLVRVDASTFGLSSTQLAFRTTSSSTTTINTADTIIPAFETEDAGNIGITKISNAVCRLGLDGNMTGVVELRVTTSGSTVTLDFWVEQSVDNVTWTPITNTLRSELVSTSASVSFGSSLVGRTFAGAYIRFVCKRTGGTSATLQSNTVAAATGSVTQPAVIVRVYGI